MSNLIRNWANPIFSALDFDNFPSSIANLPAALTINGITVLPTFRYKGGDAGAATWAPWGYGETLTLQAGTAPTLNNGSPLLGSVDDSVKFNAGGYYKAGNNTFSNRTTQDVVLEYVGNLGDSNGHIVGKRVNGGTGWSLQASSSNVIYLEYTPAPLVVLTASPAISGYCHIMVFVNVSENSTNGGNMFINGVSAATGNFVTITSLSNLTTPFCLGGSSDGSLLTNNQHLSAAIWLQSDWHQAGAAGPAEWATIAQTRFAQLCGVYPQKALGTALPSVVTRTTAGYLDKIEADGTTKLYYMGANWPRVCSRKDVGGITRRGYLSETSAQNICVQSHTFATTWTAVGCTVPTTAVLCPDGITRTTSTLKEDGSNSTHYILQQIDVTATLCFSCYFKAANRAFVILCLDNNNKIAYYDLTAGVVGTTAGTQTSGIISCGNGWYRCWISATHTSGASPRVHLASADNVSVFEGLTQDSVYLFGAQIETGNYPSTYIPTTAAAVTRTADLLRYKMDDGNLGIGKGSLECNVLCPNIDWSAWAGTRGYHWQISDGTLTNRIYINTNASADEVATLQIAKTTSQAVCTGTTDIWNNGWNKLRGIWGYNDARLLVNSVQEGTQDTSVTVPTGLTQLDVGAYLSAGYELNGLISKIKISK
jgi:hypothetical protein